MDNTDYKVTSRSHPPGAEGGGLVPQVYPRVHEVSPVDRPPPLAALVPAQVDHRPRRGWVNASVPEDQSEACIRVTWSTSTNKRPVTFLPVYPGVRHHVEVLLHVALLTDLCPPVVPVAPARDVGHLELFDHRAVISIFPVTARAISVFPTKSKLWLRIYKVSVCLSPKGLAWSRVASPSGECRECSVLRVTLALTQ